MSICKDCGAEIDWVRTSEGRYIPVNPEPEFVVEGDGAERFYDEELGVITGRLARPEEVRTAAQMADALVAFVPHWKTCRKGRGR